MGPVHCSQVFGHPLCRGSSSSCIWVISWDEEEDLLHGLKLLECSHTQRPCLTIPLDICSQWMPVSQDLCWVQGWLMATCDSGRLLSRALSIFVSDIVSKSAHVA